MWLPWRRERREEAELREQFERWLDELTSDGAPWSNEAPAEPEADASH